MRIDRTPPIDRRQMKACAGYQKPETGVICARCGLLPNYHGLYRREEDKRSKKANYIGAPACFILEIACQQLRDAFGDDIGIYQVGSSLTTDQWRDVDVRCMMTDEAFAELFPDAGEHWEFDARWLVMTIAVSTWLRSLTGLPIDFQFQPDTHANKRFGNRSRNPLGIRISKEKDGGRTDGKDSDGEDSSGVPTG